MNRPWIDPAHLEAIFRPSPAASLRASATAFEAIGRQFDAAFCRSLADGAARDPDRYEFWAAQQAERAATFYQTGDAK